MAREPRHVFIAIIGTGFSGLGMAIRLKQNGIHDFVLFERADDVGGTWRDNSYPGCACDVESPLYSFSFALNPSWSRRFSSQPEIWDYLRNCTDRFGIRPHIRFHHEVTHAVWDEEGVCWHVRTSQGDYTACVLVSAVGALSQPGNPRIPGLDRFEGKVMHSARWDHEYALEGRRVAVIGTGASAIQIVPEIQPRVGQLFVFQRTPPWVLPRFDRAMTERERRLLEAYPILNRLSRLGFYVLHEVFGLGFRWRAASLGWKRFALGYLARTVPDLTLRAKLTPNYTIGCKRILLSSDYLPALTRPNVEVVTEGIAEVRPRSIVTRDGTAREVDAIVLATGFEVTEMPCGRYVRGRSGSLLAEVWQGSPRAYLGTTVTGFPNFFILMGPNTGLGHSSVVLMAETQITYVMKAIQHLRRHAVAAIEVRPEVQDGFNAEVDARMRGTVWLSGCRSWYLDRTGRNATLWPASVGSFKRRLLRFRPADYVFTPAGRKDG